MIYKDFKGLKLSALGMGGMRFPVCEDDSIDIAAVREMISYATKKGVNYFDTAWMYHGGNSETVLGEILKDYPRDSFYLADKFPGFMPENADKVAEIFEAQLKKCQVEYFDFYLFHNVCDSGIDAYLDPKNGVLEYLLKQKENGRIRHLGFSTHGSLETLKRFLAAYGEHMEFCQIQLNWLDWKMQNAKTKVDLAREYRLPVWVMEPVRGGTLANINSEFESQLKALRPDSNTVEWAFRFLQTLPDVTVTLSGMSNLEQLKENIATFESEKPLNAEETETLSALADKMIAKSGLPCTSCRYCTSHCPVSLDIPNIIKVYNEHLNSGNTTLPADALDGFDADKTPLACIGCRACETVCPQNIAVSEMMSDFAKLQK